MRYTGRGKRRSRVLPVLTLAAAVAAYQEALAEWSEAMKAEKREKADLKATKSRMAKICESRERDKR